MITLRRAILMKADPVVSLHARRLFSGRACSCKKDPYFPTPASLELQSQCPKRGLYSSQGSSPTSSPSLGSQSLGRGPLSLVTFSLTLGYGGNHATLQAVGSSGRTLC